MGSNRTVEPGVPPSVTWSTGLVMSAQPTPGERQHKHKFLLYSSLMRPHRKYVAKLEKSVNTQESDIVKPTYRPRAYSRS